MKKFLVIAIIMVVGLAYLPLSNSVSAAESNAVEKISGDTLKKMIDDGAELLLLDARRAGDYEREHIIGAKSLPATDVNAQSLAAIAPDVSTKLVYYCQNVKCQASPIAAGKSIGAGYQYVYEYSGGIDDWKEHGYPTVKAE